ncbi:MAG: TetR/AcrR family transcriptional regulator [Sphingomonadales bacterium]|nr:TetR/AcrR family transcriptional regulator [Sphingomonadales bacterium]
MLFAQHGMMNVSTRRIAQAVGISQPSLYAHFSSANAIAGEICSRGFLALVEKQNAVLAIPGTPIEKLERLGRTYIEFGLANPDVYRIAFMIEVPESHTAPQPDSSMDAGMQSFMNLYGVVAEILGGHDERTLLVAQSCWATTHGLVSLLLARGYFPWADREKLISTHLHSANEGVLALARDWPAAPA